MAYHIYETLPFGPVLGSRRPTINEYFLSSYTLGIYHGCEIGCPYCDGWAYQDRPLNESIRVPTDLPQRLAVELDAVDRGDLIAITAYSDPYQPAEQSYRITRQVLQLLADRGQPCLIQTKSPLILDDISLLRRINEQSVAIVMTTLLTLIPHLAEQLEGRSPLPRLRLEMLATLKQAGIPVGVTLMPVIPYLNDNPTLIHSLLRACAEVGVDAVIWDYLHIPTERHATRVAEMAIRINPMPASYYRDLYQRRPHVHPTYRSTLDSEILKRCDGLGLESRLPQRIYANKLRPANEAALLLKHAAFRDEVNGRPNMASIHRQLAEAVYQGTATNAELQASQLWPTLQKLGIGSVREPAPRN